MTVLTESLKMKYENIKFFLVICTRISFIVLGEYLYFSTHETKLLLHSGAVNMTFPKLYSLNSL